MIEGRNYIYAGPECMSWKGDCWYSRGTRSTRIRLSVRRRRLLDRRPTSILYSDSPVPRVLASRTWMILPLSLPATPTFSSGLVTSRATFPSLPCHRHRTRRSTILTAPPLLPPPPRYESRLPTDTTTIESHHHRHDHHYHCHSPPRVAQAQQLVVPPWYWRSVRKPVTRHLPSFPVQSYSRLVLVSNHRTTLFKRGAIVPLSNVVSHYSRWYDAWPSTRNPLNTSHARQPTSIGWFRSSLRKLHRVSWPIYAPVCSPKPLPLHVPSAPPSGQSRQKCMRVPDTRVSVTRPSMRSSTRASYGTRPNSAEFVRLQPVSLLSPWLLGNLCLKRSIQGSGDTPSLAL